MGTVYLVRHGQASFGADNYDQLSDLGMRQCVRLGEYFRNKGVKFDAALVGTLERQKQSLACIAEGLQTPIDPLSWPGLNEYDSKAVVQAIHPEPLERPTTPELVREHFRLLREGLAAWIEGKTKPEGMISHADFVSGITSALDHVRATHYGKNVLVVSSGGPISTIVAHTLGAPLNAMIEINLRIRNSSVSELTFTPKRHSLVTYNTLPHLDSAEHQSWITYA
ncbi:histidine phosphatase family protein [Piscinibacter gummiphilus]|uniref:Histidine phosphatase family protein n=1 Tax=Piscinibacter gummiphilus TaxID=946333 RepID=A0ABZ0D3U2_9BURK|nr:histidine phosphatase family protein [Piscinibacter gummiphilus]WOB09912.1 histidine phosphatase family protein [Piscinibacter gummiphilus]